MKKHILSVLIGLICALAIALAVSIAIGAQEKPPTPLTETQKLQVANVLQRIQIAQLQIQNAQTEFEKAKNEAQALFKALNVPGYELNLQTMEYEKAKAKK